MQGQAQGHHMGVELAELQGRGMLWQGVEVHLEEVHRELAVDVMELVLVLAVVFSKVLLIDLFEVVEVVGAFWVDAFVEDEMLPVLFGSQGVAAVGAAEGIAFGEAVVIRGEVGIADLALDLAFGTIVAIEVGLGSLAVRAGAVLWDVTFLTPGHRIDLPAILVLKVGDKELPVPLCLMGVYPGELICLELLVFGGMGVIESPLFERNVSADKHD